MAGFGNLREYAEADNLGRHHQTAFRKTVGSTATVTASYIDYSYFPGLPLANFYASTPLEAAYLDASRGIAIPTVAPYKQYLKTITCMNSTSGTTSLRQKLMLCDYLMYYPFIDTDAVGELQEMVQTVSLPRYTSGMVFAVAQAASSTIGQFTMNYTNQSGVSGRVSPNTFTQIVAGGGQSLTAIISGKGFDPFVPLQAGDSGVKSIESVTFTAGGGGLMALVIVKPLMTLFLNEACGLLNGSVGSPTQIESVIMHPRPPEIKDGAVLNFITKAPAGSMANTPISGLIETLWN